MAPSHVRGAPRRRAARGSARSCPARHEQRQRRCAASRLRCVAVSAYGSPLLGRDRELAELHAALRSAEAGKGGLVLLVGEPGIGKTRLANDFASEAGARGARITWGRAWEAGGAPAYWPWIEAMRPLAALTAHASDAECVRMAPLAHLLPDLEALDAPEPAADPAQDRFRLFDAVTAFLALAARA